MWLGVHISVDGPPMQVHASSKACLPSARYQGCSAGDVCLLASWVRAQFNFFCEETRVPHCRWSCSAEFDFSRRNFCSAHVLSSFASRRSYWMQKAKWSSWLKADFSKASLFEANIDLFRHKYPSNWTLFCSFWTLQMKWFSDGVFKRSSLYCRVSERCL